MHDAPSPPRADNERGKHSRPQRVSTVQILVIAACAAAVIGVGVWLTLGLLGSSNPPQQTQTSLPVAETTATAETTQTPQEPEPAPPVRLIEFDSAKAMEYMRAIEAFGVRKGGSSEEEAAMAHIADQLRSYGLTPVQSTFPVSGGDSLNISATVQGASDAVIIIGAHVDSKPPSPGANDNGTGCGTVLELAEIIASQPVTPTVEFVFYGSEEILDGNSDHHHYGSRYHASMLTNAQRANTAGMMSIDMIGFGPDFHSRTMNSGPQTMSNMLLEHAAGMGIPMTFLEDPGWSDHEAYERAGIPAAWIEWRDDPVYHSAGDTSDHVDEAKVGTTGRLVLSLMRSIGEPELAQLLAR